jgi:transposase
VDLARFMTMSDVARWLDLSWDTIKTVVETRLEKDYRRIGYRHVRHIAIDEIYLGKTHKYVTLVVDLDDGRIIWVGEGRGGDALREFWRRFKQSGGRLRAVAMDMSGAYAASVRGHAPHAILTFDRFHVVKLMNERLDDLRRELVRETGGEAGKAIKGLRWLLLHRKDNLEEDAAKRLERSLRLNEPLQCAYLLKEELGLLWMQPDGRSAWAFLREWAAKAKASGIRQLRAMPKASWLTTRPGSPAGKWRASIEKSVASSPAPSASATRISSSFASTLFMKPSSSLLADDSTFRKKQNFGDLRMERHDWFQLRRSCPDPLV